MNIKLQFLLIISHYDKFEYQIIMSLSETLLIDVVPWDGKKWDKIINLIPCRIWQNEMSSVSQNGMQLN